MSKSAVHKSNANTTAKAMLQITFLKLLKHYGMQHWWPAKTRIEMVIGAILAQNVSWSNAKQAIRNLRKHKLLDVTRLRTVNRNKLARLIISSRFYNQKTEKIKNFISFLFHEYDGSLNQMFRQTDTEMLRNQMLKIKGIGKETADCIILYAGGKLSFPSDAYTKRVLSRIGLIKESASYDEIRNFLMSNVKPDIPIYKEFHALIDHHAYATCKTFPVCKECPILKLNGRIFCQYAKSIDLTISDSV